VGGKYLPLPALAGDLPRFGDERRPGRQPFAAFYGAAQRAADGVSSAAGTGPEIPPPPGRVDLSASGDRRNARSRERMLGTRLWFSRLASGRV
jgi:hypothetical protein